MLVDQLFFQNFTFNGSSVICLSLSEIPIWTHQREFGLISNIPGLQTKSTEYIQGQSRNRGSLSAGAYTKNFVHDVRKSERGLTCTPHPHQAGLITTLMMECTSESGLCHSVYPVGWRPRSPINIFNSVGYKICCRKLLFC